MPLSLAVIYKYYCFFSFISVLFFVSVFVIVIVKNDHSHKLYFLNFFSLSLFWALPLWLLLLSLFFVTIWVYYHQYYCVCVKRTTLCNCLFSSSPSSPSRSSFCIIRNIGKFGAKSYFTDHQTANTT